MRQEWRKAWPHRNRSSRTRPPQASGEIAALGRFDLFAKPSCNVPYLRTAACHSLAFVQLTFHSSCHLAEASYWGIWPTN
jgi:hypothetical protein